MARCWPGRVGLIRRSRHQALAPVPTRAPGGLTRFARPSGSPLTAFVVCPTGCRPLSNPGRGFSSPLFGEYKKKKARTFVQALILNNGGEGGIDSLCSPFGQPTHCVRGLSNVLSPVVEPRSGILIPPGAEVHAKKKPAFSCELFFE